MPDYCLISKTDDCRTCYKCIRNCPLNAITFENNRASIVHQDCILCGTCYNVCPQNLKVIRNDVPKVRRLLETGKVIASVAPSFISYYENSDIDCMRETLQKLGFYDAEETAVGATIVKNAYDEMLSEGRDVIISSCCHSINLLIRKYYPSCLPYLADVLSPMCAHALNIKERYGQDVKVVFIGPCIAKKDEAQESEYVDAALTYEELDAWLRMEHMECITTEQKEKRECSKARLFPETGGILKTMKCENPEYDYITADGVEAASAVLEDIARGRIHKCFIEMSSCMGSCINGPIVRRKASSVAKRLVEVNAYAGPEDFEYEKTEYADIRTVYRETPTGGYMPTEEEIREMLVKMSKADPADRLNCGCCGYDSCRDKAVAILRGRANIEMCLPLLMEKSQSLADNIVTNTPNGVLALDEDLTVKLINHAMCRIIGIRTPDAIIGKHIAMVLDPTDFYDVLDGKRIITKKEYLGDYEKHIEKTISYDEKYKILVCVVRDITSDENSKATRRKIVEGTIGITDTVLEQNMQSVHEIAQLLGETAAQTKAALEKLKEMVKADE